MRIISIKSTLECDGEGNSSKDLNFMENVYNKIITMKNDSHGENKMNFFYLKTMQTLSGPQNMTIAELLGDSRARHLKK